TGSWETNVVSGAECGDGKVCEGAGASAECKDITFCDTEGKTSNCIGWLEDGDNLGVQKCTSITYGTGTTLAWVGIGCTGGNTCKKYNDVFQCMGAIPTLPALTSYPEKISFNILYTLDGVTAGNAGCVTNSWEIEVYLTRAYPNPRDDERSSTAKYSVSGHEVLNDDGTPQTNDEGEIIYETAVTVERKYLQDVSFGQKFFIWIDGPKGVPTKYAFSGQTEVWPLDVDDRTGLGGPTSSFVLEKTDNGEYKLYDGSNGSIDEPINLKAFSVLAGDANGNDRVNVDDFSAVKGYLGYSASKGDSLRIIDMDGNCLINSGDLAAYQRAFTSLLDQDY
ncbi:MAG: hypothetical protein PHT07_24835, partial [Paludibacter sp.]|nr:hypothetical protein [Paludibacter sp.]